MTIPTSLLPPVDACASCAGTKAADRAREIARSRVADGPDGLAALFGSAAQSASGGPPAAGAGTDAATGAASGATAGSGGAQGVQAATRPLLAGDLTVLAMLGGERGAPGGAPSGGAADPGMAGSGDSVARLRAARAYGG
jgi:hypothetical protein